jgi:hypothetical protein
LSGHAKREGNFAVHGLAKAAVGYVIDEDIPMATVIWIMDMAI